MPLAECPLADMPGPQSVSDFHFLQILEFLQRIYQLKSLTAEIQNLLQIPKRFEHMDFWKFQIPEHLVFCVEQ